LTLSRSEAERRAQLNELAVSMEQKQIYAVGAATAAATYQQMFSRLAKAQLDLSRTEVRSPVDGWVTNLSLRQGDYSVVGKRALSLVDAHSFWVEGYFEETTIGPIKDGDPASVWLMGFPDEIKGHVDSLTRAINVPNAQSGASGVADVNPVFTWVRLAQRVPVRIHLDVVPSSVRLVQGMTATVQVHPKGPSRPAKKDDGRSALGPRKAATALVNGCRANPPPGLAEIDSPSVFAVPKARDSGMQPIALTHVTVFRQLLQKYLSS
jgi:multidrug resistance efflux pump